VEVGDVDAIAAAQTNLQLDAEQRVAAQQEEVVVATDRRDLRCWPR